MSGSTLTDRARQIAALVDELKPLSGKSRGMPLDATEWNTVVGTMRQLLAIGYAQETQATSLGDQRYAPKDHEHLGQVSAAWLDADLQARTASGLGTDAAARLQADQVSRSLDVLADRVNKVWDRVFGVAVTRPDPGQLQPLKDRLAGLEGLNTSVAQIARAQQTLEGNVGAVLALRTSLADPTGKPIDVAGLSHQVAALQAQVQDGLTGADGKPAKLSDLQLQLVDIKGQLPEAAGGLLEGRLAALGSDIQAKAAADTKAQVDSARADMASANGALSASLTSKVEGEIAAARDAVTASAAGLVGAAEGRLDASLASGVAAVQTNLLATVQANVSDAAAKSAATLAAQIAAAVDSRVPGLRGQLQGDLQAALAPVLQKAVADQTAALGSQLAALSANLGALGASLPAQIDAAVKTSMTALQGQVSQQVQTQMQAAQAALAAAIDDRVGSAVSRGLANVPAIAAQAVKDGLADLDAKVGSAAAAAAAGLPAQVASAVDAKLAQANVAGQIQAAANAVTAQLQGEIAASAAAVQANAQNALNASVVSLRSEISRSPPVVSRTGAGGVLVDNPVIARPG